MIIRTEQKTEQNRANVSVFCDCFFFFFGFRAPLTRSLAWILRRYQGTCCHVQGRWQRGGLDHHMIKHWNAQDVTQRTPNFATTTITASPSRVTFARHVVGTGPKAALFVTSLSVVAVERTRKLPLLRNPMTHNTNSHKINNPSPKITTKALLLLLPITFTTPLISISHFPTKYNSLISTISLEQPQVSWTPNTPLECLKVTTNITLLDPLISWTPKWTPLLGMLITLQTLIT